MFAIRDAKRADAETLAVTNVVGSSAPRECDHVVYVRARPEIGVAATKTVSSQQVALVMLSSVFADEYPSTLIEQLRAIPDGVQRILDESIVRDVAETYVDADEYFFVGRGYLRRTWIRRSGRVGGSPENEGNHLQARGRLSRR